MAFKIKEENPDIVREHRILTAMVMSDRFLKGISNLWKPELITNPIIALVGEWCIDYFNTYKESPKQHLRDIFDESKGTILKDETSQEFVRKFLIKLSKDYEEGPKEINDEYLLSQAENYLARKQVEDLSEKARKLVIAGDLTEAEALLTGYKRIRRPESGLINPFTNEGVIDSMFTDGLEPLFRFPGAMGELLNDQLVRDSLIGIMAPEKRGKTFLLVQTVMQALRYRRNVVYFSIGDMSKEQMAMRFHMNLGKRGFRINKKTIVYPVLDCWMNQLDYCHSSDRSCNCDAIIDEKRPDKPFKEFLRDSSLVRGYSPCTYCMKEDPKKFKPTFWFEKMEMEQPLTAAFCKEQGRKFMAALPGKDLKLGTYPSHTVNIEDLDNELYILEDTEGFVADVVLLDYPDNCRPERDAGKDFRHQENRKWQAMRGLSQRRKLCLIAPTQADANSYNAKSMGLKNFTEDKRKFAHVTAFYALNQEDIEKKYGILRIGALLVRENEFSRMDEVAILQCLAIGRPLLASYWNTTINDILKENEDEEE